MEIAGPFDTYMGYPTGYKDGVRVFKDTGNPVVGENAERRPCCHCGLYRGNNGHDPCISNLPGVKSACCGHGGGKRAYILFENGTQVEMNLKVVKKAIRFEE